MKTILYLHTGAELYGADVVLLTLLKGLDKSKFNPIVVLPNDGPLKTELEKEKIKTIIADYPILRRQYFNPKGIIKYISGYFCGCKKIIKTLNQEKIDIIHVNTIAVLEGIYIAKKLKAPVIWHVHEILEKPRIVFKITSFLMGRYAQKIVAVSNAVKNHLVSSGFIKSEKVEVIYNGVDTKKFNPINNYLPLKSELSIPEDAKVIGMIARINAIKGQDEFIKIVKPIIEKDKNVFGIIVGDAFLGQEWRIEELKKQIEESGVKENIRYLGFRNDANILHCLFDVYALPSVSADSLPTVVLESMASRRVVVGYKNGGICEMVNDGETGYLADIKDSKKLTKDIIGIFEDKEKYDQMAQKGFERLNEMFSLEAFNGKIENLYNKF